MFKIKKYLLLEDLRSKIFFGGKINLKDFLIFLVPRKPYYKNLLNSESKLGCWDIFFPDKNLESNNSLKEDKIRLCFFNENDKEIEIKITEEQLEDLTNLLKKITRKHYFGS